MSVSAGLPECRCPECGRSFPITGPVYRCQGCDYPLEIPVEGGSVAVSQFTHHGGRGVWRYRQMLPVRNDGSIVSLCEGGTPLLEAAHLGKELGLNHLYLKDETRNPTGTFKDRGTSVGVSFAVERKFAGVGCVSTGNMAISVAAYAARAGKKALVLVPATTPPGKLMPVLSYGAIVVVMDRPYSEIFKAGFELARELGYLWLHSDSPLRIEGQKTCAYELWEQLHGAVPDKVLVPTSSGGNISAIWKGWRELEATGLISRLPHMVVVQAEGCSPIVKAFQSGKNCVEAASEVLTEAHSISNPDPPSGSRALKLLRESDGVAEAVTDQEMLEAQSALARKEGVLAEMASAASVAVLAKLVRKGYISREDAVVCVVTGTGLRDMESVAKGTRQPLRFSSWTECRKELKRISGGTA
jgi:threonine synthase